MWTSSCWSSPGMISGSVPQKKKVNRHFDLLTTLWTLPVYCFCVILGEAAYAWPWKYLLAGIEDHSEELCLCFLPGRHHLYYTRHITLQAGVLIDDSCKDQVSNLQCRWPHYYNSQSLHQSPKNCVRLSSRWQTLSSGCAMAPPVGITKRLGTVFWPRDSNSTSACREFGQRMTTPRNAISITAVQPLNSLSTLKHLHHLTAEVYFSIMTRFSSSPAIDSHTLPKMVVIELSVLSPQ